MQTIQRGYRGLELLFELNFDRLIVLAALSGALFFAAYVGTPR
ncbi:hypothetical protein [Silicimonas sp. MF1-12-2]|jgi:hypothetical protein